MTSIERVSENTCVAKCVHISVWTTQALGTCLKVNTFYPPLHICLGFPMSYYDKRYIKIPNAMQRGQKAINSL